MRKATLILAAILCGCGSKAPEPVKPVEPVQAADPGDPPPNSTPPSLSDGVDLDKFRKASDDMVKAIDGEIEKMETRNRQIAMIERLEAISMKDDFAFSRSNGIEAPLALVAAYRAWQALTEHIDDPASLDLTSVSVVLTMSRIDGSLWYCETDYRAKNRAGAVQKYHALVFLDLDPDNERPESFDPSTALISEIRHEPPLPHVDFRTKR